jgi:hypothetical protein
MQDDKIEKITHMTFYEFYKQEEKLVLAEGLIKSYPILNFKLAVLHTFREHLLHIGVIKSFGFDTSLVIILEKDNPILEEIKKFADTYGYHLGFTRELEYENKKCESYQFDPKYPVIIPKEFVPKVGYHIARNEHLKNILKIGLTPRNSKTAFEHPGNRIYILAANSAEAILQTKEVLKGHIKQTSKKDQLVELSVLKIDINKDPTYYFDPNLEPHNIHKDCFGMFVLRNVHPAYIKLLPELSDNGGISSKTEEYHKNLKS